MTVKSRCISGYRRCGLTKWSKDDEVQIIELPGHYEVKVDKWYFERNCLLEWRLKNNYVYRLEGKRTILMHRDVLDANDSTFHVDHIDGDTLNNCSSNLRLCTPAENSYNKKPKEEFKGERRLKGVRRSGNKYCASITYNGNHISLGSYPDEVQAGLAYDSAAIYLFGEFASINFKQNKSTLLEELKSLQK